MKMSFHKYVAIVCVLSWAAQHATAADVAVVSVSPAARFTRAPVQTSIVVTFDKPIKPESIVPLQTFWAFGKWSGNAVGDITLIDGGQTVILNPDYNFSAGEQVMVILSHDIEATDGTKLRAGGYSYQFWTQANSANMEFVQTDSMTTRTIPSQTSRAYGGIASDLNGDRFLDMTIVNEDTADLRVFMNRADASGLFHPFTQPTFGVGPQASPSEPSDFNRDGKTDICVANINDQSVSILLGNGDGTYQPQQRVVVGFQPRGIAVMDFDGDGDTDIVNTNFGSNNMSRLTNNGSGVFSAPGFFDAGGTGEWALSSADMNGDGLLDLVVGTQSGTPANRRVIVDVADGAGGFVFHSSQAADGNVWVLNTGDLNRDGADDVALANSSTNRGTILLNTGTGTLGLPTSYGTDPFTLSSDLGDLNGDGNLDWVTSSYQGDWRVFTNNGNGTFAFAMEFNAPTAASCALLFDFDNDRDLDIALIDELDDVVILMRNGPTQEIPAASTWGVVAALLSFLILGTLALRKSSGELQFARPENRTG